MALNQFHQSNNSKFSTLSTTISLPRSFSSTKKAQTKFTTQPNSPSTEYLQLTTTPNSTKYNPQKFSTSTWTTTISNKIKRRKELRSNKIYKLIKNCNLIMEASRKINTQVQPNMSVSALKPNRKHHSGQFQHVTWGRGTRFWTKSIQTSGRERISVQTMQYF